MKNTRFPLLRKPHGFTLAEIMIVMVILMLMAALTLGGYNYAMRGSKRRVTESSIVAIQSGLDRYFDKYGEFPEPANQDDSVQILPDKSYRVGGAACLYQALRGDGYDAIMGADKSASGDGSASSDGDFTPEELDRICFKDMPQGLWRFLNGKYFLTDGFGRPFQYAKAALENNNNNGGGNSGGGSTGQVTINSTYDLWSYADDEVNIMAESEQALDNPSLAAKWVKNW
jgi:prepilin-type N-terminal cleavage/methylation domain-containing protein